METTIRKDFGLFAGPGVMRTLMQAHDWSSSPLGPVETWPEALQTLVGVILATKFPMFLAWGKELVFLYNDAYAEILDAKHPAALGKRLQDVFADSWNVIGPLSERALGGESVFSENLPMMVMRYGHREQTWLTFSY